MAAQKAALDLLRDEVQPAESDSSAAEELLGRLKGDGRYLLVDAGANLTNRKFSRDLDGVLARAKEAGLQKIVVTATTLQASKEALRLTRLNPDFLYCTAGVHPHDAKSWTPEAERELREIASNPECVAIGQCGLDYHRNFSPPEDQLRAFESQVALACELKKPLVLHEREAHEPLIEVLTRHSGKLPKIVLHCFTGSREPARTYVAMGCYLGLSGYLWKDKSEDSVRRVLEEGIIPLDHLLLESDSPFLYPNPRASKLPAHLRDAPTARSLAFLNRYCTFQRNEPCSLPVTLEMAAACLGLPPDDLALRTTYTALRVYGLSA